MSTLCHYRNLVIHQISHQHRVEEQCVMYLRVLSNKASDLALGRSLDAAVLSARQRINILQSLLSSMNASADTGSAVGINGILREGFQQLAHEPDTMVRDAVQRSVAQRSVAQRNAVQRDAVQRNAVQRDSLILQTIISSHHYKLGYYRMILRYFQALDWEFETYVMQTLLADFEIELQQWLDQLTSEADDVSTMPTTQNYSAVSSIATDRHATEHHAYV